MLVDGIINHFKNWQTFIFISVLTLGSLIIFFIKARSKRIYIRINRKGIFIDEVFLTDWPNFLNAYIHQPPPRLVRIRDNFELVIEHTKNDSDKGFRKRVKLTNTQNKSEEDIIAAIKYFWGLSQNNLG
jgi:hypothetical protein